jgi:hypothetical protein
MMRWPCTSEAESLLRSLLQQRYSAAQLSKLAGRLGINTAGGRRSKRDRVGDLVDNATTAQLVELVRNAISDDEVRPVLRMELNTIAARLRELCSISSDTSEERNSAVPAPTGIIELQDSRGGTRQPHVEKVDIVGRGATLEHVGITWGSLAEQIQPLIEKSTRNSSMLPAPYRYLEAALKNFHKDAPAEKSVFVMMKFPSDGMEDWKKQCLSDLYGAVKDELDRYGLVARRADQKTYSENRQLWENVCIHMFGCDYGVAILEDHVGDEFNPNVALEYGFMLSRGCKVVLLKEASFKHIRADILSTIPTSFSISKDHAVDTSSVRTAISDWLSVDLGMAPRRR